jgi:hypothetical protein
VRILVACDGKWVTDNISAVIPKMRHIAYEHTQNMICKNYDKMINFGNDFVPGRLEQNRKDEGEIKRDYEEIRQKMIDGRNLSGQYAGKQLTI